MLLWIQFFGEITEGFRTRRTSYSINGVVSIQSMYLTTGILTSPTTFSPMPVAFAKYALAAQHWVLDCNQVVTGKT